jgi:formylglycine-generating enzyme required for sulfatase activity
MPNNHLLFTLPNTSLSFNMLRIPKGTIRMGSEKDDPDAYKNEKTETPYEVKVPTFYMSQYQVTQEIWRAILTNERAQRLIAKLKAENKEIKLNPDGSSFLGAKRPVESLKWYEAEAFTRILSHLCDQKYVFRLPSEVEWEYAAKGGLESECYAKLMQYAKFAGGDIMHEHGWFEKNEDQATRKTGLKLPNQYGLYDMSGTVWEWCQDHWHDTYATGRLVHEARQDREKGGRRVVRGGGFSYTGHRCRVACRVSDRPVNRWRYGGFRLALSLSEEWEPSGIPASKEEK